jgi:hypothetical protein
MGTALVVVVRAPISKSPLSKFYKINNKTSQQVIKKYNSKNKIIIINNTNSLKTEYF